jgi:molecular chaperone GrpE
LPAISDPIPDPTRFAKEGASMKRPEQTTAPADAAGTAERPTGDPADSGEASAPPPETVVPAAEAVDFKDRWLRAEADLQNFRRRARRELDETSRRAEEEVLLDLIAVLDDLDRAIVAARDAGAGEAWIQGVALTAQRARDRLARYGVEVVDPVGQPFDPNLHEAVLEVEPPPGAAPGTVTEVVQRGYRRGDRAVRTARVLVARHHGGGVD